MAANFESSTSIRYNLKEPSELGLNHSVSPFSIYSDVTLRGENISLSFRTSQSPALLLYVNSYFREYLALLINDYGEFAEMPAFFLGSPYQAHICLMMPSVLCHLNISPAEFWVKRQYLLQLSLNDNFVVTRVPSCFSAFQYDYFIEIFITHLPADSFPAGKQFITPGQEYRILLLLVSASYK